MTDEDIQVLYSLAFHGITFDDFRDRFRALESRVLAEIETYREAGVWEPDGSKFKTYRNENLNGVAMYVREAKGASK